MPHAPRTHCVMGEETFGLLFDEARRARLAALADVGTPALIGDLADPRHSEALAQTEVLVTSWGAPRLDAEALARMPRLRAVFHAAGSVRDLVSDALWDRDVLVTSAAAENAVPVAEFTFAAIVLATKRAFFYASAARERGRGPLAPATGPATGALGRTIGVVGFSRTGRRVIDRLRALEDVTVLVCDPYADGESVAAVGAELVTLDEMLPRVDVLTLHAPALPSTRHLIGAPQLRALRDGAVLVNTARGALVDHEALLAECRTGRIDAILDVTDPEPLPSSSPLLSLPNVTVTPHLAGSLGGETRRMADAALDELEAFATGRPAVSRVRARDMTTSA